LSAYSFGYSADPHPIIPDSIYDCRHSYLQCTAFYFTTGGPVPARLGCVLLYQKEIADKKAEHSVSQ
jgi:hypothetical protein